MVAHRPGGQVDTGKADLKMTEQTNVAIVQELFVVEHCVWEKSAPERGGERLTPEIRARLPQFSDEDLLVEMVYCAARKRVGRQAAALDRPETGAGRHRVSVRLTWSNPESGHCYITRVPALGNLSNLVLFEDDRPLGPDSLHADIRRAADAGGQGYPERAARARSAHAGCKRRRPFPDRRR